MNVSTLLIVDDSAFLHKLVRAHLEQEPIVTHSAYDGESAVNAAIELRPSLVLLDVDMPEIDGFEVCRRLKSNRATAQTPIMFVTADASLCDKVKGLELGAVDYITKPFKPEELRARVRAALRTKHRLDKTSMVDGMTGLWNRSYFELSLMPQLSLVRRSGRPLACLAVDIDELGGLNERFGQSAGDQVIRSVGQILLSHCRAEDTVCHFGAGKFIALLPGTSGTGAAHMADRARIEIEQQLCKRGHHKTAATCSFGVADAQGETDGSLLDRAEAALYRSKQSGRNTVSISRPTAPEVCAA